MGMFADAYYRLRNDGVIALVAASIKFVGLRLPGGHRILTESREWLHPSTHSPDRERPSTAPPQTDWACPPYPYVETPIEPLSLAPVGQNPILTFRDVTDYEHCEFVADPFMFVSSDGDWYLFFEAYESRRGGVISLATSDDGGQTWDYEGIVLEEPYHLSFPYVFEWEDEYYMLPEKGAKSLNQVDLYRATTFPTEWEVCETLLSGDHRMDDAVLFRWDRRWWLLIGDSTDNSLYAYYSQGLETSDWAAHKQNPVINDRPEAVRPAGRPIVRDEKIILYFQDCTSQYGDNVRAYEVTALGPSVYTDHPATDTPILSGVGGRAWNSGRMHHIDPWYLDGQWWCVVDGGIGLGKNLFGDSFSIGLYVSTQREADSVPSESPGFEAKQ